MDVRGWLIFIRDWLLVLLVGTGMAGVAAFAISNVLPKTYEAESLLLVGQSLTAPNPDYSQLLASQIIAQTYAQVATTRPSLERVVAALELDVSPEALSVDVRAPANDTLLIITAQSTDPAEAAAIANALAAELLAGVDDDAIPNVTAEDLALLEEGIANTTAQITDLLAEGNLTTTEQGLLAQLQDQRETLRSERATVLTELTSAANRLTVVEPAVAPLEPVSPRVVLNTIIGAFIGLIITALATYAFDATERRTAAALDRAPAPMATPRLRSR